MKKKTFKKAGVAVLSMAMLLSMGAVAATNVSAAADTTPYSVTIQNIKDHSYSYSKIASLDTNGITYTVESAWSTHVSVDASNYLTLATAVEGKTKFADFTTAADIQALATALKNKNVAGTAVGSTSDTITLTPGYYLFTSTETGAQPMLLEVKGDIATGLVAKANEVTITKTITSITNTNTTADADDLVNPTGKAGLVANGATVTFKLATTLPYYDAVNLAGRDLTDFVITDIPENTLTNLTVTNVKVGETATVDASASTYSTAAAANGVTAYDGDESYFTASDDDTAGTGVKITFVDSYVLAHMGEAVEVTLTAVVANADVNADANSNTATVEYNNNYWTGGSNITMVDDDDDPDTPDVPVNDEPDAPNDGAQDTVSVYATIFTANKKDQDAQPLTGATFTLYAGDPDDGGTVVETINGATLSTFEFSGLNIGSYTLRETGVPRGYLQAADVAFTITNTTFTGTGFTFAGGTTTGSVDVKNITGQTLPATGGIGTILFTVGGATIVLLAGAMFVLYMKKRKIEE